MVDAIRVLELLVSTDVGGGPSHVRDLAAHLPPGEFALTVAGPRRGADATLGGARFETVATDRLSPTVARRVSRLLREGGFALVHSHGKGAGLYARLAARRAGVPAVHTFHGIHYAQYPPGMRAAYLGMERWLARRTHTLIHVSASEAAEAARLGLAPPGRSRVIVNGIDAAQVRARARAAPLDRRALGLPADARGVVGTVARLEPVKRVDLLLEAMARLLAGRPDAALLVVGDGPAAGALRQRARALGIEGRTAWAGAMPDAVRCLPAVDVFASASRGEGLPLALLEAMACGLPVVATRVPGHGDVVVDGDTGLLTDPDGPAGLAEALARVLADPAWARGLGEAGRERVERQFSARRMASEVAEVYRAAVASFRGRSAQTPVV